MFAMFDLIGSDQRPEAKPRNPRENYLPLDRIDATPKKKIRFGEIRRYRD